MYCVYIYIYIYTNSYTMFSRQVARAPPLRARLSMLHSAVCIMMMIILMIIVIMMMMMRMMMTIIIIIIISSSSSSMTSIIDIINITITINNDIW